jgi:hypothetical protein
VVQAPLNTLQSQRPEATLLTSTRFDSSLVTNLKLNIMSKIKKVDEVVDFSVFTKFTKDLGLFQVNASIWSMVSQDCTNSHDISDIELDFFNRQ